MGAILGVEITIIKFKRGCFERSDLLGVSKECFDKSVDLKSDLSKHPLFDL